MLFKNNKLFSSALHGQVLIELNHIDRIYVKSMCCIGNTDANGNLNVIINKDKTHNLCNPGEGKSLFHMQCTISAKRLATYPALKELVHKLYPIFLPLPILNIEAYFLVEHTSIGMVDHIINNPEGPVDGTTVFKKLKPVFNPGTFGKFILCNPKSVGNLDACYNTKFNEAIALQTLGNLTYATFQTTQESSKSNTTTQKTKRQGLFSRLASIFHKKTPLEKGASEESQKLLEEEYEELGAVGGIDISDPICTQSQQNSDTESPESTNVPHKTTSDTQRTYQESKYLTGGEEENDEISTTSSFGTSNIAGDPESYPLATIYDMSASSHHQKKEKH
ncbi:Hypothetical protein ERGA_CDS_05760 [Ehrlichia ruminantium str. Gardel]|uniref:DUF3023 domain-containing protein n=1 Tax=Ehrlichia ruminantium TaxID=779 RepID=UPI00004C786A|nr:DUF3023 domain-containing protein [Ehrlichia ruminantium]CAI28028.1 Hypothetical protein ERGA_CDS_05760 [Ehrlichia ruminantium str. Gardel]